MVNDVMFPASHEEQMQASNMSKLLSLPVMLLGI